MIFNDIDFTERFKILDIRRPLIPSIFTENREVRGKDGNIPLNENELEQGLIEVDIEIKAGKRETKRNELRELAFDLFTREEQRLCFKDEPDKYYLARITGETNLEEFYLYGNTTLVFSASSPISYGKDIDINISNDFTIDLKGTYKTTPIFEFDIAENIGIIELRNLDNGKFVKVEHSFKVGDKVEIDFGDKWKVRKGETIIAEDINFASTFFDLEVGENNLRSNIAGKIKYKERWL